MKKFISLFVLLVGLISATSIVNAQRINISVNINSQPAWGPTGYDYVRFYYFPDIDCYYDVNGGLFIYSDSGRWISARYLPHRYCRYDMYGMYKVVINTHDPWLYNRHHRRQYARYKGYHGQVVIRDSYDRRYHRSRNNDILWYREQKQNRHNQYKNRDYNRPSYNRYDEPQSTRPARQDSRRRDDRQNPPSINNHRNNRQEVKPSEENPRTDFRLASNQDNSRSTRR